MAAISESSGSTPYIMTTVEELVETSKAQYESGLLLDKGYYKDRIPASRGYQHITKTRLNQAYYLEAFLDIAKRVTTIAVLVIPSVAVVTAAFGSAAWLPAILGGGLAALMSDVKDQSAGRNPHVFEVIKLKANLSACFDQNQKVAYTAREFFLQAALKTAVYALIAFNIFSTSTFFASASLFFFGFSYGQEAVDFATAGLESYFNRYRRVELENQAEQIRNT